MSELRPNDASYCPTPWRLRHASREAVEQMIALFVSLTGRSRPYRCGDHWHRTWLREHITKEHPE